MSHIIIRDLVKNYKTSSLKKKDVLREVLQQAALLGLARHNFFEHAAFYGGTALRILYQLDRLSEDLDFSLLAPNLRFDFSPYLEGMQKELASWGFHVEIQKKEKESTILSAFLKGNTLKQLLAIEEMDERTEIHPEEKIWIKFEIDTDPPSHFEVETKLILKPTPFYVLSYQPQDLFAGKMHAILCREWKSRVKGRDWYDLIWFIKNSIPVHLEHLEKRMIQSGHLQKNAALTKEMLQDLLKAKIATIDWSQAKNDVKPFLADPKQLDLWSESFFLDLIKFLKTQ